MAITNLHYQRAKPSPLWSRLCPKILMGRRLARIARVIWGKRRATPGQGVPASHGASWRRTGGGDGGESDPLFFGAGTPPGRGRWCTPKSTTTPPLFGGRSHHRDPCGKAKMLKSRTRVVQLNLALIADGLRTWFSPWLRPSEAALLGLARPTDPFKHALFVGVHIVAPTVYARRRPGVYNLSNGRKVRSL